MVLRFLVAFVVVFSFFPAPAEAGKKPEGKRFTNSIGMNMVRIEPGTFMMGAAEEPLPDELASLSGRLRERFKHGDFDEVPRHKVTISNTFYMSQTEVTLKQYRNFKPDFPGFKAKLKYHPYVSGLSWQDAVEFCQWLSKKEGRNYRLPTEAEWEYACRAGAGTPFYSGYKRPAHEKENPWGLKNMHNGVREWCYDWYGGYPETAKVDPVGMEKGWLKVVRGGGLDYLDRRTMSFYFGRDMGPISLGDSPYYSRSSNRAALPPSFGPPPRKYQIKQMQCVNPPFAKGHKSPSPYRAPGMVGGWHYVGFRVVLGPKPDTEPEEFEKPFVQECVSQKAVKIKRGPDPGEPYYNTRRIFTEMSSRKMVNVGWKVGLPPGLGTNQHNGALVALDNGDLLACYYNGFSEKDPDLTILLVRLRHGSREWDIPSPWPDFLDGNDASPFIRNDSGRIWLGWGGIHLTGGYPFHWTTSDDNGASWEPIQFPVFDSPPGGYGRRQPINCHFRSPDGTLYVAFDGWGSTSGLWASADNGATWYDTGGRCYGLHSTFVLLDDNKILAYATRNRTIDGFAPKNVSTDWGKSYEISKSPMPGQGGGQNPIMIKLESGNLLYVSDFQWCKDESVKGFTGRGCYACLSEDQGRSWTIRKLTAGGLVDENGQPVELRTVGYVGAAQSANGLIHLVTSRNHPDLHIVLNEAWILQKKDQKTGCTQAEVKIRKGTVKEYYEDYPSGKIKARWHAGIGTDGRYLLDGEQIWYYENGFKKWEVNYEAGRKAGTEKFWNSNGVLRWKRQHNKDGSDEWTVFNSDGEIKAHSLWRKKKLVDYEIMEN